MLALALFSVLALPQPPLRQGDQGVQVALELLKNFGETKDWKDLQTLRVQLRETRAATAQEKARLLSTSTFSMAYPNRLRVEERPPGGGITIYLWEGKEVLMGPGGGPFVAIQGKARERILSRFELLAALFCWDLLPFPKQPGVQLKDHVLQTTLRIDPKSPGIPIRRVLGNDLRLQPIRQLVVHGRRYRCGGRLRGKLAFPSSFCSLAGPLLEVQTWSAGYSYKPEFFRPRKTKSEGKALVHQGGEEENFAQPILKRLPPSYEICVPDPKDWEGRAKLLDRLGRKLFALGQEPSGMPLYGVDGRIRIQFVPSEGKTAKAPKGIKMRALGARVALVLYARGPFEQTMKSLERRLRAQAKEMGVERAGTFLGIPTFFPSPGGPFPGPKESLTLRGELLLR